MECSCLLWFYGMKYYLLSVLYWVWSNISSCIICMCILFLYYISYNLNEKTYSILFYSSYIAILQLLSCCCNILCFSFIKDYLEQVTQKPKEFKH